MKGKGVEEKRKAVAARCGKALRKGYTVVAEKEVGDSWNKTALPAALLTLFPDLYETKTQAKKACRRKQVLVNKVASKCDVDVVAKDVVTITSRIAAVTHPDNPAFTKAALEVVYEDEHLAVVVKPQGTDTLGKGMSAMALLPFTLKPTSASFEESKGTLNKPRPCHRLDKATGGLLVCAKTSAAMGKICSAFSEREVHKTYVALVHGKPREEGIFEEPVDGKEAITEYYHMSTWEIGGKGEVMSTVKLFPKTGRTHQLRKHLSGAKLPIVGDKIYAPSDLVIKFGQEHGMFLWCAGLAFCHPITSKPIRVEKDPPHCFTTYPESLSM